MLGGHDLAELYAVAHGVDPRLILSIRPAPSTPLRAMRLEDLAAKLARLADQAAEVIEELDRRADHIRGLTGEARQAWGVRK